MISPTCVFIPFVEGHINYYCSGEKQIDAISYPFTGCIMAHYKIEGLHYYAHISTPHCTEYWNAYKRQYGIFATEFRPHEAFLTMGIDRIYGIINAEDEKYSVAIEINRNEADICRWRNFQWCNYCYPRKATVISKVKWLL